MNADRYNALCYNALRVGLDPPHLQQKLDHEGGSTMQPQHNVRPDQDVLSAWREGLAEASRSPDMEQQLLQREPDLLMPFAEYYAKLKRLPRRMRRSLQRQWKRSLAGIALLFALGATPALAATINVGGSCTLVRAIVAANNNTTATGHCTKGSGADRIVMPRNSTVTLTAVNNTNYGPNGLPIIHTNITIDGNGSTIKRAASAPKFRIFAVRYDGDLRLQEATVSGGATPKKGFDLPIIGEGGGLLNNGTLTLANTTVSGNRAGTGGGVNNSFNADAFTVINSTISGNSATRNGGGGVYNGPFEGSGPFSVTNSTISGNSASRGGGVNNNPINSGPFTVTNSIISGNSSTGAGGGVQNDPTGAGGGVQNNPINSGPFIVSNSTISGNSSTGRGGGVQNSPLNGSGPFTVTNSTISGNSASRGGGVYNSRGNSDSNSGYLIMTNSTISGNRVSGSGGGVYNGAPGHVQLNRTLVSGNSAPRAREIYNYLDSYSADSYITASNFNIFGHAGETSAQAFRNFTPSGTDITATSNGNRPTALNRILNTTLANNGGPTKTHALVGGSPAVDAINDGTCPPPARDQRGVRRPQDGNGDGGPACDVGSFERQ